MIRAVICDDEKAALNIIRHFLDAQKLPIEIIGHGGERERCLEPDKERKTGFGFHGHPHALYERV